MNLFPTCFDTDFGSIIDALYGRKGTRYDNVACYKTEKDGAVTYMFDLPGCKRDDISVEFTENGRGLSVSAKRMVGETELKLATAVVVSNKADIAGEVKCEYADGVLSVTIPPKKESQPRKLTIL